MTPDEVIDLFGGTADPTPIDPTDILVSMLTESAIIACDARRDDDLMLAAVAYGRVSALFDVLAVFGLPVPGESPAAIIAAAERLADEAAFQAEGTAPEM